MVKKFLLFLVIAGVISFNASGKEKFLRDQLTEVQLESHRNQVVALAVRLAQEKEAQEEKRRQERAEKERKLLKVQMIAKMNKIAAKKEASIRKLLLRAHSIEKKRRLRYKSWRNYLNNRKAAQRLEGEVRKVDRTNSVHVQELREEISEFASTRIKGRLYLYSVLNDFMS